MTPDELADHLAIQQVLYRYCRGVDRGDAALIRSVYHDGAVDAHGSWQGEGRDFAGYVVAAMDGQQQGSQHHITNVLIELQGDEAAVESYFLAYHPYRIDGEAAERLAQVGGRYLDRFQHRDGRWAISRREVVIDWSRGDLPGAAWPGQEGFPRGGRRQQDPSAALFREQVPLT